MTRPDHAPRYRTVRPVEPEALARATRDEAMLAAIREDLRRDHELNAPRHLRIGSRFTDIQIDLLVIASGVVAALVVVWLLVRVA